ncbi:MAG: hypothetical protein D6744_02355 [Planctomycetota bacterium]|nr:MAG: hypothetical protein D6744_02355 [Planctomycetota bacterium]
MAIQFPCPHCHQPIEVDDQFARMSAQCPYCQTVVSVPEASVPLPAAPVAARPADAAEQSAAPPPPPAYASDGGLHAGAVEHAAARRARLLGTISAICALLVCCVYGAAMMYALGRMFEELAKYPGSQPSQEQVQEISEQTLADLQDEPWFTAAQLLTSAIAVVGLATGIASLLHSTPRRKRAWIGVIVCGLFTLCLCGSIAAALTGATPA